MVLVFLWLLLLSTVLSGSIHVVTNSKIYFFLWLNNSLFSTFSLFLFFYGCYCLFFIFLYLSFYFLLYFIDYAIIVILVFPPLLPSTHHATHPQAIPPPLFMSTGHACKFFGYSVSYTVLYIPWLFCNYLFVFCYFILFFIYYYFFMDFAFLCHI